MKRTAMAAIVTLVVLLVAGAASTFAQGTFKIPFKFQAGGKKLPAGDYTVMKAAEGQLTLRQEATGKEFPVTFTERLAQPKPPVAEPQLVFDEVGDFEPSYTEYFTVYILSEVWFAGEDGFRVHTTKGAHQTKVVKGVSAKK
ncbi:MAG: hypothetical protein A2Y70_07175 [Candidatus Aminicenantes bacterium RBG_13_64_14]|nr:MAG: hypothetical protein A2Y70_07175 [Candidatus Aminicenantes bacterium RBG_13_64_14]